MKNGLRIWYSLMFSKFSKGKVWYGERTSKLRKRKKSEEFEDYIPSEWNSDYKVDDKDEVFLQVRVAVFCVCTTCNQ